MLHIVIMSLVYIRLSKSKSVCYVKLNWLSCTVTKDVIRRSALFRTVSIKQYTVQSPMMQIPVT